jgi:hypothetical protein
LPVGIQQAGSALNIMAEDFASESKIKLYKSQLKNKKT